MTAREHRRRGMASSSKSLGCYGLLLLGAATTLLQPVHAITLLNGRFETTSDVQDILNFALDATAMREATSIEEKKNIYENGKNAGGISIASLSANAAVSQAKNPIYHFFRQAFFVIGSNTEGEPEGEFDGSSVDVYAKTIVEDLFDLNVTDIETEAALVMIIWMSAVTELFNAMDYCKNGDSALALQALDKAVAYWVGEGQVDGSNEEGSLLYNLAEIAGERFGQDNGETAVNTELMTIFLAWQTNFQAGNCAIFSEMTEMRASLKRAVGVMTIPLAQMMIHHVMNVENDGGSEYTELYALTLIPRVSACDPRTYQAELKMDVLRNMSTEYQGRAIETLQAAYSCLQISCADVGTYEGGKVPACSDDIHTTTLAGYSTDRPEVRGKSFIDRDVMQIDILLKYDAFGPALDWYQYGWNSVYSLQELARNEVNPIVTDGLLDTFDEYWESTTAAHDWIINALEQQDEYAEASYPQLRATVSGFLSHFVLYLSSVNAMQFAVQECLQNRQSTAMEAWDAAVAFYVGSMVGDVVTDEAHGVLLFSVARYFCDDFNTCLSAIGNADAMDSESNINIMAGFRAGILSIGSNSCQEVVDFVENSIIPQMAVPLFQGVVKYASINVDLDIGATDASLATGDTFARALLPTLDTVNPESAELVYWNMLFQLNETVVVDGFDAVTDALRQCLEDLPTKCFEVGMLQNEPVASNLCTGIPTASVAPVSIVQPTLAPVVAPSTPAPVVIPDDPPQPAPTRPPYPAPVAINPEDIAWGRYVFSSPTEADGFSNFALDIRDMFEAPGNTAALSIYTTGVNAVNTGLSGVVGTVSLQSLNTDAAQYMSSDPMFNIYKYALYSDVYLEDTDGGDFLFADEVVLEAMSNGKDHKLAAEAAVVLNIWMVIAHKLNKALETCRASDNPDIHIDAAVALWIGKGQLNSKFDSGWLLYSIAQSDYKFYGHPDGESPINTKLMQLFNEAQSLSRQCSNADPNIFIALRENVNEAIRYLSLPLIKTLLFHLVKSTKNLVELYSVAVIPQSAACNPKTNEDLQELLFSGYHRSKLNDKVKDTLVDFLRCQRVTCADIEVTSEADEELAEFVNSLCSRLEPDNKNLPMAGYQPTSDVTEYARLDQDTMLIQIFMVTKAYGAAKDVYEYGFSSKRPLASASGSNFLSWRNLAIAADRAVVPMFELYSNYFNSQTYADDIIMEGLTQTGTYAGASRWQLEEVVVRTLQTMVGYMSTLAYMQGALDKCKNSDPDGAVLDWDVAIAIMVGSIEGQTPGEQIYGNGRQMYGLGNEMCPEFNTCEGSGESRSNEILMFNVAEARNALMVGECKHLERKLSLTIRSNLDVSLLQAVLYYAEQNVELGTGTTDEDLSTAHIMSLTLEPLVKDSNATAAQILARNFGFDLTAAPMADGTAVVYKALANSVRAMGIDCADIGKSIYSDTFSVCDTQVAPPIDDTPTNLGNDLYVTTTYVQDRANIAKDISDMMEALTNGEPDLAELIYREGKNSEVYDENGKFQSLRTLAGFSKDETAFMLEDPVFNLFLFGNKSSRRRLQTAESRTYANDYVMSTFSNSNGSAKTLPAEAALALNLWMYLNHLLYDTLRHCGERKINNDDGVHSIDEAVAYWIGDSDGSGAAGSLLYGLAEEMGEIFKLTDAGQSRTNANMMRLFNEAKNELTLPNACTDSPTTVIRLRSIVDKISAQMTIPLIQGLIHNIRTNDRDRVSLYAHAYVPLVAGCSPNAFEFLRDKLLKSEYNVIDGEAIVSHVRDSLFCLGLQCDDIGPHPSEVLDGASECKDPDRLHTLAGYKPAHDVREFARFDLDLLELDIFMQMGALKPAQDIYTYGKHVRNQNDNGGSLSLYHLATTSDRSNVDQFETFTQYYQANDYADKMIQGALSSADNAMSDERRRVMVVRSSQVLVMYFGALQAVNEAVTTCSDDGENGYDAAGEAWDKAAAMLIGSLEGADYGGSRHGYMFYDLAQKYCLEFGTCEEDLDADLNADFTRLLYAGRGAVLSNSCGALKKAADELSTLVLVPVIQGLLSSSIQISSATGNADVAMVEGYIFSRAVLPLVDRVNRDAANTISNNLGSTGPQVTSSVASEVFSSMSKVYNGMKIDCKDIGKPQGFDPCSGVGKIKKQKSGVAVKVIVVLIGLCVLCIFVWCVRSRRREAKSLPENNPKFVAPEGELNHSMDLLQKAFSGNGRPTSETDKLTGESYDASPAIGDHDEDGEAVPLRESAPDII